LLHFEINYLIFFVYIRLINLQFFVVVHSKVLSFIEPFCFNHSRKNFIGKAFEFSFSFTKNLYY